MAMDLVTGAVGSLISKLGELFIEEYKLQKGVPEKIRSIIKELECAHAALKEVAEVPPDQLKEQVRIWAREVREASYDIEDVLDTFVVSAQGDPEQTDCQSLLERIHKKVVRGPLKRCEIASTIDDINNTLKEVTKRRRRYTFGNNNVAKSTIDDPRLEAVFRLRELFGVDEPCGHVISRLWPQQRDDESKMKMVSIVGPGGLGKTTVAKTVYDRFKWDSTVCTVSAFVPVGREPDLNKVFRDILIDLDLHKYMDPKYTILDQRQLVGELREYLKDKRYFIVVDDVWETKSWERIKLALVENNNGSRLITTTRIADVAHQAGEVYELKPLPHHQSEKLFYTRIFGANRTCPDQLREVCDKILNKCDGVPLAIITMASLLVGKPSGEWIEVCKSVFRDKRNRQGNQQVSDTEWILSLSYYDMPPHLKTCLLYLSAFPEDCFIEKSSLIWMWVAEGFVQRNEGTGFFEVGEEYFNGLINRNMIQAVKPDQVDDIVNGCRVHDMVLIFFGTFLRKRTL